MLLERMGGCTGKQPVGGVRYGRTVSKFMEISKNGNESRVFFRPGTHPVRPIGEKSGLAFGKDTIFAR